LLEFTGDLYGRTLEVEFVEFLRPEQRFDSLDSLRAQIAADAREAARLLTPD
jgi:riboflavin kinase/FMN adenylyltransferase